MQSRTAFIDPFSPEYSHKLEKTWAESFPGEECVYMLANTILYPDGTVDNWGAKSSQGFEREAIREKVARANLSIEFGGRSLGCAGVIGSGIIKELHVLRGYRTDPGVERR